MGKALHLIAVMSWLAGFFICRLFVYHSMVEAESVRSQTFKLMERRLLKNYESNNDFVLGFGLWLYTLTLFIFIPDVDKTTAVS